ncbi:MAG TPA: hypothetical protein DCS07_09180 [Bdellovibrionales bacterium]|nr:MAG: hypothetical protein A2Z97_14165 [Bdellovibrionales bacterium GWB1_52_6]OFZ04506.1 MAG: hypothetical protein A2X97_10300 [Bdellovibrionales bacterium GWA1_52_35]OFZ37675.1 MAG: hypothetical protein A2070_00765 [Bdellovibrionales bacterium GWC1_52_8]HAR42782.1 hypothetical protein [Bdellovibrionales bacterium]HCM38696.1 hypothetical protein [Bdellovibrionales bacterium]
MRIIAIYLALVACRTSFSSEGELFDLAGFFIRDGNTCVVITHANSLDEKRFQFKTCPLEAEVPNRASIKLRALVEIQTPPGSAIIVRHSKISPHLLIPGEHAIEKVSR